MAGNISNSNIWDPASEEKQNEVRGMFSEMVDWAVDEGADLIIGETFYFAGEALAAAEIAKASGLPVVLTLAPMAFQEMADGVGIVETAERLEQSGVDVVGLNCFRGPATMLAVAEADPAGRVLSRRRPADPLPDHRGGADLLQSLGSERRRALPARSHVPHRARPAPDQQVRDRRVREGGVRPRGQLPRRVCGATPMHIREVAEAVGLTTEASRFSENMSNHFMYGDNERLAENVVALGDRA